MSLQSHTGRQAGWVGGLGWKRCKLVAKSHSSNPHHHACPRCHLHFHSPHSCYLNYHCIASLSVNLFRISWNFQKIELDLTACGMNGWFIKSQHISANGGPDIANDDNDGYKAGLRLFFFHCTDVLTTFLHWWVMLQELRAPKCNAMHHS